ncbi:DUF2892 domain-containing protein [Rhodobacteraceae bacterium B1Z28]|uniref:DUF2892 domain-containing protein n=1 Tax=Ruegeria haliotis TaxID=2747601 RepID=A0ABX2PLL1_9RHOB|nr:DUF2892 domain-containing protein [Ruegeria haliotis]NVO54182.1 DUF2892 domain-containing protein [Ruegeria haliotis]
MQFTSNVGSADRILRLILGGVLILLALTGTIGVWGWLGAVFVVTAFIKFCPIYAMLGLCTNKKAG